MDSNSGNCSPSAHPTSAAVQIWSANSANNCSDEQPQHQQIEIDNNSPECSHNEEGNVFSHHHHQEVDEVADYSQNHVSHASSSNMYDSSEVKLSPSTSDLEPHSLNHAHSGHYEEGLQVYSQQNNNGDEVSEIPSTTTDQPQERVIAHELKHYVSQQPPNSSEDLLKSYHQSCHHHHHHNHDHRHHLNAFSPQPPTSSTSDYQVHLENYDDTSHLITYNSPPEPDSQDHHYDQRTNERNLEVGDGSTSNEVSIPVSVSSSDVLSSSNIVRDPSPSHNEVLQVVSDSHSYASAINEVGTIQEPNESHHESSSHQLNSHIIQDDISAINMHREGSPLENSAHSTAPYYSHESLDPSLVHLVNQRFTSLMGSGIVSLPPHKELLVESVVRSMIGTQPGRLYSTDLRSENVLNDIDSSRLSEDPETSLSVKEMVVSSMANDVLEVDRTFPVVSVSGTLHVEPSILSNAILDERALTSLPSGSRVTTVLTNSLPRGLLTLAPGSVPLELVGGNILVGHSIVEPRPSTSQIIHPPREATPGIVSSLNGVSNVITTTAVIHERELSSVDSLVQVSHISEATPIQNYVSSSTGGLENEVHDLSSHTIILDTTVDSTVGTSDVSHLEHAKGLVGSTSEHYISEVDHQEAVALKYPSDVDVDHYSVVSTHDDQLDSGHGVSTTAEIIDQERGILLISSGDSRMNNVLSSPSTASTTTIHVPIPISESVDGALSSSSIASESLMSTTSIPDNQQTLAFSRPRRYLTKQRSSKNNDIFDHGIWCEECNICYENGCPKHRVQTIYDKPVQTRARASLPASYLSISKVSVGNDGEPVYGVFAKKIITKRTQFGPLEGVPVKKEEPLSQSPNMLVMQIESETGEFVNLDTSDEGLSNWMRFVRAAEHYREQNLVIFQQGQSLYYTSTRNIMPRTELKVGYSTQYASQRNLRVLEPDAEMKAEEEQENSWPCFECNRRFLSSEDLQQHLNDHDITEAPIECEIVEEIEDDSCTSRKRGRPKNKVPKKIKGRGVPKKFKLAGCSGQEMFECNLCQKVFPRQYSLQRHQAMHSGEKKFKCSICEMKFTHVYNRNRHMRRHRNTASGDVEAFKPIKSLFKKKQAGGSEWLCTHCDLTFDNASLLNLHTLTHAAEDVGLTEFSKFPVGPVLSSKDDDLSLRDTGFENGDIVQNEILQCPECTQDFHTRKELIDHASTHGKVVTRKSFRGIINPAKPYKCELCYKSFATEDRLQRHMLVHGNEDAKPLQCSVCDKRFLNNSALACHIKVHSDEKKCYECPICKEEFDQIVSLKEHIRIHSINGLFTCPTCQKTFEEYNQIRKHIRAFHSEKKFPCEHCDKIFPRPDKLKLHMLRHSNHREFLCANCGKQFKRKDKLKEHMKRMHSAEREARLAAKPTKNPSSKKFIPKVSPTDYHRFIYKCHACLLGFKRRGMLVNHLAKRHPDIRPESVPELNLPILKTTRDYYCQYCDKVYKSSSKRKAHILKQHPGAELPMSNRRKGGIPEIPGLPNPTFSQTVGSITTHPHNCEWCHKQYASKAKLLQHQRKKHLELLPHSQQVPRTHLRDQGHKHVEQQTAQYITVPAAALVHQQITATTQTSEMEFDDGTAVVIADIKPKIITTIAGTTTSIYMDQEDGTSAVVVSASDLTNQTASVDALPPADLLTQAMSELTQSLTDYRPSNQDYQLARVTQSCPPTVLVPSPSSTPIPTSTASSHVTIEQTQLGQLLGHYEASEQAPQSPLGNSPQQVAITTHSSTFVPRTWEPTYTDYPAR